MNILAMVRAESRYVFVSFSFPAPPSPLPRARPDEIGTVSVFDQSGIALVHEGLFRVARLANGGDQVASRRRHGARHHRLVNLPLMARLFLAQVVDVVLGRRLRVQRNGVDAPPIADVGRRRRRRARRRRRSETDQKKPQRFHFHLLASVKVGYKPRQVQSCSSATARLM